MLSEQARYELGVWKNIPSTFSETLIYHMKRLHCTCKELSESSWLDIRTIQNMRNNKNMSLKSVMAVCIGMQLEPCFSDDLIKKAGYTLTMTQEHRMYVIILRTHYNKSIADCNWFLVCAGFDELVKAKQI